MKKRWNKNQEKNKEKEKIIFEENVEKLITDSVRDYSKKMKLENTNDVSFNFDKKDSELCASQKK